MLGLKTELRTSTTLPCGSWWITTVGHLLTLHLPPSQPPYGLNHWCLIFTLYWWGEKAHKCLTSPSSHSKEIVEAKAVWSSQKSEYVPLSHFMLLMSTAWNHHLIKKHVETGSGNISSVPAPSTAYNITFKKRIPKLWTSAFSSTEGDWIRPKVLHFFLILI